MLIQWVVRTRPCHGELLNGDEAVIHAVDDTVWVGVFDGLGHGKEAALAASQARSVIQSLRVKTTMVEVVHALHEALRKTRGTAATLACFDREGVEFTGVGNVALRSLDDNSLPFVPIAGVLGKRIGRPRTRRVALRPGARLLLTTDGIRRRAPISELDADDEEAFCECLLNEHSRAHDDATVALVRFLGIQEAAE